MTPIEMIQPLWSVFPADAVKSAGRVDSTQQGIFADIFQNAIEQVKQTDAKKNEMQYLMATGQLDNPAELTMASTNAQMSVELLVQLRNKALDAYSELARMSL